MQRLHCITFLAPLSSVITLNLPDLTGHLCEGRHRGEMSPFPCSVSVFYLILFYGLSYFFGKFLQKCIIFSFLPLVINKIGDLVGIQVIKWGIAKLTKIWIL